MYPNLSFMPMTANPYRCDDTYMEIEPCAALKPYIRCFWGSRDIYDLSEKQGCEIVIPDTCMDIIFEINYTENASISNFCGIADVPFMSCSQYNKKKYVSRFGIRFYAWSAVLFSEESMKNCKNFFGTAEIYFSYLVKKLEHRFYEVTNIIDRVHIVQDILLKRINLNHKNCLFNNTVQEIMKNRGTLKTQELAEEMHVSSRQLERVFKDYMGMPPKKFSSLVRYQCFWNDVLFCSDFQIQNEVFKLKYTDQAHLLHDFKKYHGMPLSQARILNHLFYVENS